MLASQISSLKTLKYDGLLIGYFVSPNAVYSMAQPGAYLDRALQQKAPGDHYAALAQNAPPTGRTRMTPEQEAEALADRVRRAATGEIREIDVM